MLAMLYVLLGLSVIVSLFGNLPDANHTDAIYEQRGQYEQRVVAFLDRELRR